MRPEQTAVEVGETDIYQLTAMGYEHRVIEVVYWTTPAGNVPFTTPGISLQLLNVLGEPLEVDAGDDWFSAFVVQITAGVDIGKYLVGVFHPGDGMHIQDGAPSATPINEVFTLKWQPGTVTIMENGAPVAGKRVTILITRTTADGNVVYEDGAPYKVLAFASNTYLDSGGRSGVFLSDASGIVRWVMPDKAPQTLRFSRYPGNVYKTDMGDRVWDMGPAPREWATAVTVWCEGVSLDISPGVGGIIDISAGSIALTGGVAGAVVNASLEHCEGTAPMPGGFDSVVLDGAGAGTITGLAAGRYCLEYFQVGVTTNIAPRAWVDVARASVTAVGVAALQTPTAPNNHIFFVWRAGAIPMPGEPIYSWNLGTVIATTDANGRAEFQSAETRYAVNNGTWGYQEIRDAGTHPCRHVCLAGYAMIVADALLAGGITWWNDGQADINIPFPGVDKPVLYVRRQDVPAIQYRMIATVTGIRTEDPIPQGGTCVWEGDPLNPPFGGYVTPPALYTYEIIVDEVAIWTFTLPQDGDPHLAATWWERSTMGDWVSQVIGARVNGNITDNATSDQIDTDNPEYEGARMGIERGAWNPTIEMRVFTTLDDETVAHGAVLANICPYCLGPVNREPMNPTDLIEFGHCAQCGTRALWPPNALMSRTYYDSPTVTPTPDTITTAIVSWSADEAVFNRRDLDYWYPPIHYLEDAAHILQPGRGMNATYPAPRWFSQNLGAFDYHVTAGRWDGATFTQGNTAQDIATDMGIDGALLMRLKIIMAPGSTHTGTEPVPVGVYGDGRIDVYEGVACAGECDEFTQAFWETKFGAVFPANWWQADNLADMIARRPEGSTWVPAGGAEVPWIWDMVIVSIDPTTSHAAILHDKTGAYRYAHSNYFGDELGYMGTIPDTVLGWFHWGAVGRYRLHYTRADDSAATVDFIIPDGFAGRSGLFDWEDVLFLTDRLALDADDADSPWPSLILAKAVTDIEPLSGSTNNNVRCVADVPSVVTGPIEVQNRKRVAHVAVYGPLLGVGGLHIAWHDVAQAMLITETLLADDVGYWKVQRQAGWSDRIPVPNSDDTRWANAWTTEGRTELIEGDGFTRTRLNASLDGDWNLRDVIDRDYKAPMGILAHGMLYMTAYKDGTQYLLRRERWGDHDAVAAESVLPIAASDEVPAGFAFLGSSYALACAIQRDGGTYLYRSQDNGQAWEQMAAVAGMLYPALYCDGRYLWHAGYTASSLQGAPGRVSVSQYDITTPNLTLVAGPIIVGPSDSGRPGILRNPLNWALIVLTPKTSEWTVSGATPGIAEFKSTNLGTTWSLVTIHAV